MKSTRRASSSWRKSFCAPSPEDGTLLRSIDVILKGHLLGVLDWILRYGLFTRMVFTRLDFGELWTRRSCGFTWYVALYSVVAISYRYTEVLVRKETESYVELQACRSPSRTGAPDSNPRRGSKHSLINLSGFAYHLSDFYLSYYTRLQPMCSHCPSSLPRSRTSAGLELPHHIITEEHFAPPMSSGRAPCT